MAESAASDKDSPKVAPAGAPPVISPETTAAPPPGFDADYTPLHVALNRDPADRAAAGPIVRLSLAWITGIALSAVVPVVLWWLLVAIIAGLAFLALRRHAALATVLGLITVVATGATWSRVRDHHVASDHLSHYITAEAQLAQLTGTIEGPAVLGATQRGPFAQFSYEAPTTAFIVNVHSLVIDGRPRPTRGRLMAKLRQADPRLAEGDVVQITGWMQAIDGPSNPGEFDLRALYASRNIDGRIALSVRGNCKVLQEASTLSGLHTLRSHIAQSCSDSLRLGLQSDPVRIGFLDTLLLGRWSRDLDELSHSFRRTGLIHILSISGAHLTILMLLVWAVVHLLVRHPSRAALVVLTVLLFYMMAVPWRAPIVRAGIMAGLVCVGAAGGRQVRAIDMIALSALVVFIWRPADVFNAGAQLSFGVVAGLVLFTPRVSQWIHPDPPFVSPLDETRQWLVRRACDYVAVNLVAFLIAVPLVAHHFQFISPLSMFLSLLSLPVITAVIGLGYLKMLAGLVLPSLGTLMAGPLEWVSDSMTGLVTHASGWPGSTMVLGSAPSGWWLVATLLLVTAMMGGLFAQRRGLLMAAGVVSLTWLLLPHHPRVGAVVDGLRTQPPMRINMFAVGDGSCFLVRIAGDGESPAHTLMFDCGSLGFLEVGSRSIVPALRSMNVNRIDTLIISHADLDHFCGVPDLAAEIRIGRVLVPPQLLQEAEEKPESAAAFLINWLRERRLIIEPLSRGMTPPLGAARAEVLWPPAEFEAKTANSTSIVLSLQVAGRRLLLNGDIDQVAIPLLLAMGDDLRADIADLPHHGSFVRASPQWFAAVQPRIVLQSSGRTRLRTDQWAAQINDPSVTRLITARLGMVEVTIDEAGTMTWSSFRDSPITQEME